MNIYVSNLNFRTRGESLQTLFGEYGEVSSANIITDRENRPLARLRFRRNAGRVGRTERD